MRDIVFRLADFLARHNIRPEDVEIDIRPRNERTGYAIHMALNMDLGRDLPRPITLDQRFHLEGIGFKVELPPRVRLGERYSYHFPRFPDDEVAEV